MRCNEFDSIVSMEGQLVCTGIKARQSAFAYDAAGRITDVSESGQDYSYVYDADGNRTGIVYPSGDLIIFRSADYTKKNSKGENEYKIGAGPHNHIGIVVAERYPKIYTIEGNTGNTFEGSNLIGEVKVNEYEVIKGAKDYIKIMGYCSNGGTSRGDVPPDYSKGTGEG